MARETDPKKRIVITGMGLVSCFGNDYEKFYDKLLDGVSGVKMITRFDTETFPTKFAAQIENFDNEGIVDKKNARRMDDCLQYALVSGNKALVDAGLTDDVLEGMDKTKIGVLAGSGMGGLTVFQDGVKALVEKGPKKITPFFIPYAITNMGGALLAIEAAGQVAAGFQDIIVAGGVEAPIIPVGLGGFVACRALSSNNENFASASKPWDKNRDGFVMGEGAGLLVMESLESALKRGARIHAEYLGGAITCDAYGMTDPLPDGSGVGLCIEKEVNAVKKAFKGDLTGVKMNGTKSMVGHCLGAAAGVEAVATIMAIKTGYVHPTINNEDPIDEVADIDIVANVKAEHKITAAISNSFGFGGHNSCCIFAPYEA